MGGWHSQTTAFKTGKWTSFTKRLGNGCPFCLLPLYWALGGIITISPCVRKVEWAAHRPTASCLTQSHLLLCPLAVKDRKNESWRRETSRGSLSELCDYRKGWSRGFLTKMIHPLLSPTLSPFTSFSFLYFLSISTLYQQIPPYKYFHNNKKCMP